MTKLTTLNEIKQLEESGFGQQYPRHGLKLLHWFAKDCVRFDKYNNMCWCYDPEYGYFDFHPFQNRPDIYGQKLLPDVDLDYYEVGNLREPRSDKLPDYVLEDYNQNPKQSESNMDRIIFSVDDECIDEVYVTEHIRHQKDFNKEATYRISRGLIMIIRNRSLEEFLSQTGYSAGLDQSSTDDDDDEMQDDRGQRNHLSSRAEEDPGQRISGPQEIIVQISPDNEGNFHYDNPPSRCRCVIL